jgi:hypothetical protein
LSTLNFLIKIIKILLIILIKKDIYKNNFMGIGDWGLGIGDWGLGDRKSGG